MMKRMVVGAALLAAAPFAAQAQTPLQPGGFYIAAEGGANWIFNTSPTSTFTFAGPSSFGTFSSNSNATSTPVSLSVARSATTSSAFASRPKASIGKTRARWRSVG